MWMCPCVCVCDRFPTLSDILRVWFRKTVLRFKTEIYSHRRTYSSTHNYTHTKPPYINRKGVDEEKKENATINFKFPTGGNELRYERDIGMKIGLALFGQLSIKFIRYRDSTEEESVKEKNAIAHYLPTSATLTPLTYVQIDFVIETRFRSTYATTYLITKVDLCWIRQLAPIPIRNESDRHEIKKYTNAI